VAVSVNASLGSSIVSLTMRVRTSTLVPPAAIVALVALIQLLPPLVETCRFVAPPAP
jgi:hypothetical protein